MKRLFTSLAFLALATLASAQAVSSGPVTKVTSGDNKNHIREDLTIGPGRTLRISEGTLAFEDGTIDGASQFRDALGLGALATLEEIEAFQIVDSTSFGRSMLTYENTSGIDLFLRANGNGTASWLTASSTRTALSLGNVDNTSDATKWAATATLTNKTLNLTNNTFVATSAQLRTAITDETGTGAAVFADSPTFTGTPGGPTAAAGTQTTQFATTAFVQARANTTDTMRTQRDALFFGRAQSGSHAYWSSTEHGIIGANDFTFAIPVIDWWYSTSPGTQSGLFLASDEVGGTYAGSGPNNLSLSFDSSGALNIRLSDALPNQDTNYRRYVVAKANFYDVAANKPGVLVLRRVAGVWSLRLNTQNIALPVETVNGAPVSTWAGSINSTYMRLGQVFSAAGYLGKLGVPLVYSLGLSDAECDILVTQGPRALPYRHGSFKNYAPTSGTSGWSTAGTGFTITTYDLATDADGIGLPAGGSTSDYCIKIVRSGGSAAGSAVFAAGVFRQGGPVWKHRANVKVTSLPAGTISYGVSSGVDGAPVEANGQINGGSLNVGVAVAEGWKAVAPAAMNFAASATGNGGPAITTSAAATDFVAYIHAPVAYPLGLLFDGVVQPNPTVRDNGPNRMTGVLVNRVDPITSLNRGTVRGQLTWAGSHEAKALIADQALIPPNSSLESIVVTASANTSGSGIQIGDGDTTAHWVASTTLTSGADKTYFLTLANRIPGSAAANDLKIYVDPDSANYTGTLNVTVNYVLTY